MIDKIQKIKEWISKTQDSLMDDNGNFENPSDETAFHILTNLDYYIDSLQEEPVKDRFAFKAIPRLLDMIEPTDRAKAYIAKLADALEIGGYSTDAKIVRESLKIMNGEKVPLATMDKDTVNEELEEAAKYYIPDESYHMTIESEEEGSGENVYDYVQMIEMFKAGAKCREEQLLKNAISTSVEVTPCGLSVSVKQESLKGFSFGDKVKVIIIKED